MRRLKSPANDGGLPYLNSDFNTILQTEHLKAYGSFLDGINDWQINETGVDAQNRGIVMRGCRVVSSTSNSTTFDFSNSLIYLPTLTTDGDFMEPVSALTSSGNYTIAHGGVLYIVPAAVTEENRTFRDAQSKGVIENKQFTITATLPALTSTWIEFRWNGSLGRMITNRRYKRVMKYFTANVGDVFTTGDISDFDPTNGLGVGDMYGFALCIGVSGTYDLRGRFVIGYNKDEATTPTDNTTLWDPATPNTVSNNSANIKNYGAIGNKGGGYRNTNLNPQGPNAEFPSEFLQISEMPGHNHGGNTGQVIGDMNHTHNLISGDSYSGPGVNYYSGRGNNNNLSTQASTGGVNGGSLQHTHGINSQGGGQPHEIRSPYIVLAYYQKINVS